MENMPICCQLAVIGAIVSWSISVGIVPVHPWLGGHLIGGCVLKVCASKCRLAAGRLSEPEPTRFQHADRSMRSVRDFSRCPFVAGCIAVGFLRPLLGREDSFAVSRASAWRPCSPPGHCQCLPSPPPFAQRPRHARTRRVGLWIMLFRPLLPKWGSGSIACPAASSAPTRWLATTPWS